VQMATAWWGDTACGWPWWVRGWFLWRKRSRIDAGCAGMTVPSWAVLLGASASCVTSRLRCVSCLDSSPWGTGIVWVDNVDHVDHVDNHITATVQSSIRHGAWGKCLSWRLPTIFCCGAILFVFVIHVLCLVTCISVPLAGQTTIQDS
jgi:hypothetical protein